MIQTLFKAPHRIYTLQTLFASSTIVLLLQVSALFGSTPISLNGEAGIYKPLSMPPCSNAVFVRDQKSNSSSSGRALPPCSAKARSSMPGMKQGPKLSSSSKPKLPPCRVELKKNSNSSLSRSSMSAKPPCASATKRPLPPKFRDITKGLQSSAAAASASSAQ